MLTPLPHPCFLGTSLSSAVIGDEVVPVPVTVEDCLAESQCLSPAGRLVPRGGSHGARLDGTAQTRSVPHTRGGVGAARQVIGIPRGSSGVARGQHTTARGGGRSSPWPKLPKKRQFLGGLSSEPLGHFDRSTLTFVSAGRTAPEPADISPLSPPKVLPDIVHVDELRFLGSYSWTDSADPTIMVPGAIHRSLTCTSGYSHFVSPGQPVIWQNVPTPFTALPDGQLNAKGTTFRDQNSARLPLMPLVPLFAAVDACLDASGSSFDWLNVDFISDRNGLRKLLRWVEGSSRLTDFRIEAEMVGTRTVLLGRWEKRSVAAPQENSFGFGFERAATRPDKGCEHATGYCRIVTYASCAFRSCDDVLIRFSQKLGDLRLVARCEVDACYPLEVPDAGEVEIYPAQKNIPIGEKGLRVVTGGRIVPQSHLIELKTKKDSLNMCQDWREILPQLLLSGTPTLIRGVHTDGVFKRAITSTVGSEELEDVEARARAALGQLRPVLSALQIFLQKQKRGEKFSLICRRKDRLLQVHRRTTPSLIPGTLMARFEARI
jgi:hypothetical protein